MMTSFASRYVLPCQMAVLALLMVYQFLNLPPVIDHTAGHISNNPPINCNYLDGQVPNPRVSPGVEISTAKSFGACLLIQDDNHFLPEWLAYHYHSLPLRNLIVAVDPRSMTSPSNILDRYRRRGLMRIVEWHEEYFMPPEYISLHAKANESDLEGLETLYLERQIHFYTKCMAVLKHEGMSWVAVTDTDEYILPNPHASEAYRLKATENMTVFEMLEDTSNRRVTPMIKRGCVSMHRLQFGHQESNKSAIQNMVPSGFNGSDLATLRWRYHGERYLRVGKIPGKCMINLDKAADSDFVSGGVATHRPIRRFCTMINTYTQNAESPFVVNHYTGSWEQWNYRNDFRAKRLRENFDKLHFDKEGNQDDSIRPWLQEFVLHHGVELTNYVLRGAGQVEPKANS